MSIQIQDVLKLNSFKMCSVLAGQHHLSKNVSWVYLAETFPDIHDTFKWLTGQELLFIVGYSIKNSTYTFLDMVDLAYEKDLSGLVVFLGDYISAIPDEVIERCNDYGLPLITLPWAIKYVDVTQEITRAIIKSESRQKAVFDLMDAVIFSEIIDANSLIKRAYAFGIDFTRAHRILVTDIDQFNTYIDQHIANDEFQVFQLKSILFDTVVSTLSSHGIHTVHMQKSDSVISLIESTRISDPLVAEIGNAVSTTLSKSYPGLTVSIGLGSAYDEVAQLRHSYDEAEQVLRLKSTGVINKAVYAYDDLNFYALLCQIEDTAPLRRQFPRLIKPIIDYDKANSSELLHTLEHYLYSSKSLSQTAKELFIHRNTVKYRIDKVKQLTGLDFRSMEVCFNVLSEIKICRFLKPLNNMK